MEMTAQYNHHKVFLLLYYALFYFQLLCDAYMVQLHPIFDQSTVRRFHTNLVRPQILLSALKQICSEVYDQDHPVLMSK